MLSCVWLLATPWTSPPGSSVHGMFKQEYCSGLPFFTPGDLPEPGIETTSLVSSALAGGFFITSATKITCPLLKPQLWAGKQKALYGVILPQAQELWLKDGRQNEIWILLRKENKRLLIFGTKAKMATISTDIKVSSHWSSFQRNCLHTNLTEKCRCYQRVSERQN